MIKVAFFENFVKIKNRKNDKSEKNQKNLEDNQSKKCEIDQIFYKLFNELHTLMSYTKRLELFQSNQIAHFVWAHNDQSRMVITPNLKKNVIDHDRPSKSLPRFSNLLCFSFLRHCLFSWPSPMLPPFQLMNQLLETPSITSTRLTTRKSSKNCCSRNSFSRRNFCSVKCTSFCQLLNSSTHPLLEGVKSLSSPVLSQNVL